MRICIVAEGCYPYVVGGVSSWVNSMIKTFPDYQYTVLSIVANRSFRGKFVYDLPENVVEIHELYLEDYDFRGTKSNKMRKIKMTDTEFEAIKSLLINQKVDWDTLFRFFGENDFSLNDLLMGPQFLQAVKDCYRIRYPEVIFSDFLWTMRSCICHFFWR